jgi:hypothetical protein
MTQVIPTAALVLLPLSREAVADWAAGNDLHRFLAELFGTQYATWARELYDRGTRKAEQNAGEWTQLANDADTAIGPGAEGHTDPVPDFIRDRDFGWAWKHWVAWDGLINAVLSESVFFSEAHALETEVDLDASFVLVGRLYYKHALQVLRSFIEDAVLPVWFATFPEEFVRWKQNDERFRVFMRKKRDGILDQLVAHQKMDRSLAAATSRLYGELNGAIHANEMRLIHRGTDRGQYRGEVFKRDDFAEWCARVSDAVAVGAELLAITVDEMHRLSERFPLICVSCHNTDGFTITTSDAHLSDGGALAAVHCVRCGNDALYDATLVDAWLIDKGKSR